MFGNEAFASIAAYFYRPILVAGLFLLSSAALAAPQIVECHDLIGGARKTGMVPTVTSDPDWGVVRISTSERSCREPIEVWNQRGLPWPVEIMPGSEAPQSFLNLPKAPAPVKEVEKPAPIAIEATPVAPIAPAESVAPEPIPPQVAPPSPEPVVSPYGAGTNQPSIISEPLVMPIIDTEGSTTKAPSLADLVQSRMRLGAEETKDENPTKEEPKQADVPYLWIGLAALGLAGGVAFLFFYRRSSGTKEGEDGEDEDEEDDL